MCAGGRARAPEQALRLRHVLRRQQVLKGIPARRAADHRARPKLAPVRQAHAGCPRALALTLQQDLGHLGLPSEKFCV